MVSLDTFLKGIPILKPDIPKYLMVWFKIPDIFVPNKVIMYQCVIKNSNESQSGNYSILVLESTFESSTCVSTRNTF